MPNLFVYLDWRGDVPFGTDEFNEVDALVLSELSYTKFEDLPDENSTPIFDARELFFNKHTREELLKLTAFTAKAPILMDGMCDGARFSNTKIYNYESEIDREKDAQFSATTFLLDDGTAFVAFRGTDGTVVGWKEDFNLSYLPETEGQRLAVAYLNKIGSELDCPIRVGGHSKGGNFACYAASFCEESIQNKITCVYSFDGPGFKAEKISLEGYKRILPKIIRIIPDTSIIGKLLTSDSKQIVIKSNASGMLQHDAFSWKIKKNRFVRTDASELSVFIEKTMGGWLDDMSDDDRKNLTDTVFALIESTGNDTFREMSEQKWKTAEVIMSSAAGLPKESRQELKHLIGKLLQTGGHNAAAYFPNKNGNKD